MNRKILIPDRPPRRIDPVTEREWKIFIVILYIVALGWLLWMLTDEEPETMYLMPESVPESKGYFQNKVELTRV